MVFCGDFDRLPDGLEAGIGLDARLTGWKLSSSTLTKFDGKSPTARLSLRKRPVHHEPSPALRHSIRSPSTNPRSLFDSPPHEYVALHQQGNRVGRLGATCAIVDVVVASYSSVYDETRRLENYQQLPARRERSEIEIAIQSKVAPLRTLEGVYTGRQLI